MKLKKIIRVNYRYLLIKMNLLIYKSIKTFKNNIQNYKINLNNNKKK